MLPLVSVIITTKNAQAHIKRCLDSIRSQNYPGSCIEIIVVDNKSNDDTARIARQFTDYVYDCGPERSVQRNYGVKKASGKYILYLDVDMALSENVVSECVDKCERGGYIALYIPERIIGKGFWARVRNFERSFYDATVIDCVRFVRRDKFMEIGGFDAGLTGPEDWDFDRRILAFGKPGIIQSCLYHDEGEFNLRSYLRKKLYYAMSFDKYSEKWGRDDSVIKKQLGFCYRYFVVFCEKGKFLKLIRHPGLAAGLFFLRGILGLIYSSRAK